MNSEGSGSAPSPGERKIARARMRWDCAKQGCFNVKRRPKIELFADCFPGQIYMGDVDGICEINRHFILMEWKTQGRNLPCGQKILYERLSAIGFYVMVVVGDAETMAVEAYCDFWGGRQRPWHDADLKDVRERIRLWVRFVAKA